MARASDRGRRALAHLAAAALIAAGVASCTSVLSLDGYADGAVELCELLSGCYEATIIEGCGYRVAGSLQTSKAPVAAKWLGALSEQSCLDNCSSARTCLDLAPVCKSPIGEPCENREECCGFLKGGRDCLGGRCCVSQGQPCEIDIDCCDQACDPRSRTCGGTVCRKVGTDCNIDKECCSESCARNKCAEQRCRGDGFDCKDASECCSEFCSEGRCAEPACGAESARCAGNDDCCAGLTCYQLGTRGFCSTGDCTPREVDCQTDAQCCTDYCDPAYHVCADACRAVGEACAASAHCCSGACGDDGKCAATKCSKVQCENDGDCCSEKCVARTCAPACVARSTDHEWCEIGPPIDPSWTEPSGVCAALICETDSYCCCNEWDWQCVAQAAESGACKDTCL